MTSFILKRIVQAGIVMFGVATITFFLIRAAPGDPITQQLESTQLSSEYVDRLHRLYGLDQSLPIQYGRYLSGLARGDLGVSFAENRPVTHTLLDRLPNTILLALAALFVDFGLGIALGVWQGMRAWTKADRITSLIGLTIYATPSFWLGIMFVLFFSIQLKWFPTSGAYDPLAMGGSVLSQIIDRVRHLVLPAMTLGMISAAGTARFQRDAFMNVKHLPFVVAARARGLRANRVILHILSNSLLTTITLVGLSLPLLLSGTVLVESVFGWPGMGSWLLQAVDGRDYPVVTAAALLAAAAVVFGSLAADVTYRLIDPRLRSTG